MGEDGRSRRVTLGDVAKGVVRAVPELLQLDKGGLLRLATLRPKSRQSIGRVLEHWARRAPDRVALRFEDQAWTYRELNAWVNRLAATLAALGVGSGDTVGVLMKNRPELLVAVAAAVKLGAIAGLLNHHQRQAALAHSIGLLKTRVLIVSAECQDALETTDYTPDKQPGTTFLWHGGDDATPAPAGWRDLADAIRHRSPNDPASTRQVRAEQPCYYVFTSGTTGLPKASVMTHYRWLSSLGLIGSPSSARRSRSSRIGRSRCSRSSCCSSCSSSSSRARQSAHAVLSLVKRLRADCDEDADASEDPAQLLRACSRTAAAVDRAQKPIASRRRGSRHDQRLRVRSETGFELHAEVRVPSHDRGALERLCRYMARPPIAEDRLVRREDGRVELRLKRAWKGDVRALVFEPVNLIARLAALIPLPYQHARKLFGAFAARHPLRDRVPASSASCPAPASSSSR